MLLASAYRTLTADQLVNEGPTLLCGYELNVSTDGGGVTVYDGMDAISGSALPVIQGLASETKSYNYGPPVLFNNGLYVDIGANVTSFVVYYIPLRGGSPLQAYPGFMISEMDLLNG